jgi:hypothetical protein
MPLVGRSVPPPDTASQPTHAARANRWEQRPKSPPLTWENADDSEAVEPPPSAWLRDWDLAAEGLAALALTQEQQPHAQQQPGEQPEHPQETQQPQPAAAAATQTGSLAAATPAVAARQHSDPAALAHADLEHVKDVLLQHSGGDKRRLRLHHSDPGSLLVCVCACPLTSAELTRCCAVACVFCAPRTHRRAADAVPAVHV